MEFWKILLDDIKEPVSYLPMGVGAAIMMLFVIAAGCRGEGMEATAGVLLFFIGCI